MATIHNFIQSINPIDEKIAEQSDIKKLLDSTLKSTHSKSS